MTDMNSEMKSYNCSGDKGFHSYSENRISRWDEIALELDKKYKCGEYYHERIRKVYQSLVPPGCRVLELGCGRGDLLAALNPSLGVGVEFSSGMIDLARARHPHLTFIRSDVHEFSFSGEFDVVILSDLVNDLWDVQHVFRRVRDYAAPRARIIINFYSHLWEPIFVTAQKLNISMPLQSQNWLTPEDLGNLLYLEEFEVIKRFQEICFPLPVWPLDRFFNQFIVKLWPFRHFALSNFIIARPKENMQIPSKSKVSVIIPARNEEGNIPEIIDRIPEMGKGTEIVFVEGGSDDDTYGTIEREMALHPDRNVKLYRQSGKGKGDAVRLGFSKATGDIYMILDADMTVPPEELPRFYDAISSGKGEFVNGVRLVYPMKEQAMRFLNLVGNKFFSLAFTWLLGQTIKDTLCGTKVMWKEDYERLAALRKYLGDFDPFGDFDLLFGAAMLNLKIIEIPIRYQERKYGFTNIKRFRHGFMLLKMVLLAAKKIKFTCL